MYETKPLMALRIISAISSMRPASQQVGPSSNAQRAYERLSSGQRITDRPSDVAIISALRRDTRLATAALTNASQGVSLVSVADQALSEISALLGKMYDLADASASSTFLTIDERLQMQSEYAQMASQVNQIAASTTFNGFSPFGSISANVVFQVGMDGESSSTLAVKTTEADLEALGLQSAGSGDLKYTVTDREASSSLTKLVAGALADVETKRAAFSASADRLQVSIANLTSAREGIAAAQTGIEESTQMESAAEKSRAAIIQDATAGLLAQANQEPLSVARLLEGDLADKPQSKDFQVGGAQQPVGLEQTQLQKSNEPSNKLLEELKKR